MTSKEIRETFLDVLRRVAPEVDPKTVRGDQPLRDQVDLDSMDLLNVMIGLSEKLGVDIPETDYGRMTTIDQCVAYLTEKAGAAAQASLH